MYFSITLFFAQPGLHLIHYLNDSESNDSTTTGDLGHSPSLVLMRISLVKLVHFTNKIIVKYICYFNNKERQQTIVGSLKHDVMVMGSNNCGFTEARRYGDRFKQLRVH